MRNAELTELKGVGPAVKTKLENDLWSYMGGNALNNKNTCFIMYVQVANYSSYFNEHLHGKLNLLIPQQ